MKPNIYNSFNKKFNYLPDSRLVDAAYLLWKEVALGKHNSNRLAVKRYLSASECLVAYRVQL